MNKKGIMPTGKVLLVIIILLILYFWLKSLGVVN